MPPPAKGKSSKAQWGTVGDQNLTSSARLDDYQRKKKIAYAIVGIVIVISVGIITSMALWFSLRDPPPPVAPSHVNLNFGLNQSSDAVLQLGVGSSTQLTLKSANNSSTNAVLHLGTSFDAVENFSSCGTSSEPCYQITARSQQYTVALTHDTYPEEPDFKCTSVSWTGSLETEVTDCIELGNSNWYGGGLMFEQKWPMKLRKPMTPFVSADILELRTDYGSVLEPYWLSTDGFALSVEWDAKNQPLHTSWDEAGNGQLCIMARYRNSPYVHAGETSLKLKYSVCVGKNIEHVHKSVLQYRKPWAKPTGIPSLAIFQKPIWSTWVSYKSRLTQTNLQDFIRKIDDLKFPVSNIEIDDGYHEKYGDFSFNKKKFPSPGDAIAVANARGFNVTIWVHPFVNYDADSFLEALEKKYYVWTANGKTPALTSWWEGKLAGMVDFTNPAASKWYFDRLKAFRDQYGIESFKFDAGESNWTPATRAFHNQSVSPDFYGKVYVEAVAREIGNGLEVRVGLHTQQLPIFVRMLDKDSVLGYDNGLRSMIPTALIFGLLGYPFILPDMIGGNAYRNTSGVNVPSDLQGESYPSEKLYLRWLGATVFMPSIQFSLTPWYYESSSTLQPVNTTLTLLALRAKYTDLFIELAKNATVTGHPIIRPLWWINGNDAGSWTVDDQFLVGDNLMVAPVLDPHSNWRTIYIPPGVWYDELKERTVTGPLVSEYLVPIDRVPIFHRKS